MLPRRYKRAASFSAARARAEKSCRHSFSRRRNAKMLGMNTNATYRALAGRLIASLCRACVEGRCECHIIMAQGAVGRATWLQTVCASLIFLELLLVFFTLICFLFFYRQESSPVGYLSSKLNLLQDF